MNEMNFEHLSNGTFPEHTGLVAGYEKPAWKMNEEEVEKALMPFKTKEINNQKLDTEEQYRKGKLLERKAEFE